MHTDPLSVERAAQPLQLSLQEALAEQGQSQESDTHRRTQHSPSPDRQLKVCTSLPICT